MTASEIKVTIMNCALTNNIHHPLKLCHLKNGCNRSQFLNFSHTKVQLTFTTAVSSYNCVFPSPAFIFFFFIKSHKTHFFLVWTEQNILQVSNDLKGLSSFRKSVLLKFQRSLTGNKIMWLSRNKQQAFKNLLIQVSENLNVKSGYPD